MPVGTQATVKAISQEDLEEIGYRLILGNTYHLYLRPGRETMRLAGGIHKFMSWPHAVLTDSGGYQAFSLSDNVKLLDTGVVFRSHLDGSEHIFSPEHTIAIERDIGSDIIMPIDDCAPYPADHKRLKESLARTHRWLAECKEHWLRDPRHQNLFGIVQGGVNTLLRADSAKACADLDLPGYAVGGLSVGEPLEYYAPSLAAAIEHLPKEKPRYVMGVGTIPELLNGVALGVDMFDCVLPTRNARNGQALTWTGRVNIKQARNRLDDGPLDPRCDGPCCNGQGGRYTRGYLRHLFLAKEILAARVMSLHNIHFLGALMRAMRGAIAEGRATTFVRETLRTMREGDEVGAPDNG